MFKVVPVQLGFAVLNAVDAPIDVYKFNPHIDGSKERAKKLASERSNRMNELWCCGEIVQSAESE